MSDCHHYNESLTLMPPPATVFCKKLGENVEKELGKCY